MEFETGRSPAIQITPRQRWSIAFSYVLIAIGILLGINQRETLLHQISTYSNVETGITASYPARWLLEESESNIFRVRDMSHRGFNTEIEVRSLPVGSDNAERNLLDRLSMQRARVLIDYTVLGYDTYSLPDETQAVTMAYAYVSRDASPFLEGESFIVRGLDILTLRRGQALVITFRADSSIFQRELQTLTQFINNLQF
ncbi:MAG: hypothetical protein OXG78_15750 [Chloroflexi bacterium]|nr:hypothetical protein [Chloroflexota bacterium]